MNVENVIEVQQVSKAYKNFEVKDLSFSIPKGYVTGFIGANGAGKSTTIKLLLNLVKKDSGSIKVFGLDHQKHEKEIKERIGFVFDENVYYDDLTLLQLRRLIAPMYSNWDDHLFHHYVTTFQLPEKVKLKKMSKGMKMKVSLAFALSHHADLIIMDEPTSGLDPIFRREILEILYELMQDENKTIFFSSHITTDLDKIADYITFIQEGRLIFNKDYHSILEEYGLVKGSNDLLTAEAADEFVSVRKTNVGFEALSKNINQTKNRFGNRVLIEKPSLEDIMYFTKKGNMYV